MMYEDALITIDYPDQGVTNGHIVVSPKQAADTVDDIDDDLMTQLSFAASYAATVLFETLGAQGTNIILNEKPVRYDVIARSEGDGWNHQWSPVQLEPQAMTDAANKISTNTPLPAPKQEPLRADTPKPEIKPEPHTGKSVEEIEEVENQLIRQLTRIP